MNEWGYTSTLQNAFLAYYMGNFIEDSLEDFTHASNLYLRYLGWGRGMLHYKLFWIIE
jgi:hypothetical protein